jgi:hypothetical protein
MEHRTISLYVLKKGNGQFMVSKIYINGYVKYTKTGDGCWIPEGEGDTEVETSEKVSDNEVSQVTSEKVNKGSSQVTINTEGVSTKK